jgi:hypothetical protein
MKKEKLNSKDLISSFEGELDQRREKIFVSFVEAWNKLDDRSLKEVLTDDVKIIERDFSVISGIKDVIRCLNVIPRMMSNTLIEPGIAIMPPLYIKEVDAFKVIITDLSCHDLLITFKMILRGNKIAEIETHYNEFFSRYPKYIKSATKYQQK